MLGILDDVHVLELTNHLAGAFCAKLLADQGARTLKVEPPGRGDAARHEPPFIAGEPHPERSSLFLAFNTNKRGVTWRYRPPLAATCCYACSPDTTLSWRALRQDTWRNWGWGTMSCDT